MFSIESSLYTLRFDNGNCLLQCNQQCRAVMSPSQLEAHRHSSGPKREIRLSRLPGPWSPIRRHLAIAQAIEPRKDGQEAQAVSLRTISIAGCASTCRNRAGSTGSARGTVSCICIYNSEGGTDHLAALSIRFVKSSFIEFILCSLGEAVAVSGLDCHDSGMSVLG